MQDALVIRLATKADHIYANKVSDMYRISSNQRGTGIAIRQPEYIKLKIDEEKAMIAFVGEELAGFCYIETFSKSSYVSNSGLIVSDKFRSMGIGKSLKKDYWIYACFIETNWI